MKNKIINNKKKILTMLVIGTLLGDGITFAQNSPKILGIGAREHYAEGEYLYNKKGTFSTTSGGKGLEIKAAAGKEARLVIDGEIIVNDMPNAATNAGLISLLAKPKAKLKVHITKGSKILTLGNNSDAVWLWNSGVSIVNDGKIYVTKSSYKKVNSNSKFALVLHDSSSGINNGLISAQGATRSSGVLIGHNNAAKINVKDMAEQFINNGTIEGSVDADGIASYYIPGYDNGAINNGIINIKGNGSAMQCDSRNEQNITFVNNGKITTEKGAGIFAKAIYSKDSKIYLKENSDIHTTGPYASGIYSNNFKIYSLEDNKITTDNELASGILTENSEFNIDKGKLSITTNGKDSAGTIIGRGSKVNINSGKLEITTKGKNAHGMVIKSGAALNNTNELNIDAQNEGTIGLKLSEAKVDLKGNTFLKTSDTGIDSVKSKVLLHKDSKTTVSGTGRGIVLKDSSDFNEQAGSFLDINLTEKSTNGLEMHSSKVTLEGDTRICAENTGIKILDKSDFTLKKGAKLFIDSKKDGIVTQNGQFTFEPGSILWSDTTLNRALIRGKDLENMVNVDFDSIKTFLKVGALDNSEEENREDSSAPVNNLGLKFINAKADLNGKSIICSEFESVSADGSNINLGKTSDFTLFGKGDTLNIVNNSMLSSQKGSNLYIASKGNNSSGVTITSSVANLLGKTKIIADGIGLHIDKSGKFTLEGDLEVEGKIERNALVVEELSNFTQKKDSTITALGGVKINNSEGVFWGTTFLKSAGDGIEIAKNGKMTLASGASLKIKDGVKGVGVFSEGLFNEEKDSNLNIETTGSESSGLKAEAGKIRLSGNSIINSQGGIGLKTILKSKTVLDNTGKLLIKGNCTGISLDTDSTFVAQEGSDLAVKVSGLDKAGLLLANSNATLNGESNISSEKDGVLVGGNSKLILGKGSRTNITNKCNGIVLGDKGIIESLENSVLNINVDGKDKVSFLVNGKNAKAVLRGKNNISTKNNKYGMSVEGVNSELIFDASSQTNIDCWKESLRGIEISGENASFITKPKSQTNIKVNSGEGITLYLSAKGVLGGNLNILHLGDNAKGLVLKDKSIISLEGDTVMSGKGNNITALDITGGKVVLKKGGKLIIDFDSEGAEKNILRVMDGGEFIGENTENLSFKITGDNSPVIYASSKAQDVFTKVSLNGGKIDSLGKSSPIVYADGKKTIVTLNNIKTMILRETPHTQVENGGTVILNNITGTSSDTIFLTNTTGNITANDSVFVGDIKHAGKASNKDNLTGELNISMKNTQFTGGVVTERKLEKNLDLAQSAKINLNIDNASVWDVKKSSHINGRVVNEGLINMQFTGDDKYETISMEDYAGKNGSVMMDTDLESETTGDKIIITNGTSKGVGRIQLYDQSLIRDKQVEGEKKLLLVEDPNGATSWSSENLDTGGIWDVVPTIERGDKIGLSNKNWYLSKVSFVPTIRIQDMVSGYIAGNNLWKSTLMDDLLHNRLGDLRDVKDDSGVWARMKTEKVSNGIFNGSSQMFEVGIDKKVSQNTHLGFAVSHSKGSNIYTEGSGKASLTNLSLYVANIHPSGLYSDWIIRFGKLRNNIKTSPIYQEVWDYDTWAYSISYELGKKINLGSNWFVEPQGQLSYGFKKGGDTATKNGVFIKGENSKSILGRVGVNLGRKIKDSQYYLKTGIYKEFLDGGPMNVKAINKYGVEEKDSFRGNQKNAWIELGLGANVKLSKKTYFYGDVVKTFGGYINNNWQVNAGMLFAW